MRWITGLAVLATAFLGASAAFAAATGTPQNFGSVQVGTTTTLTFQIPNPTSMRSFAPQYGAEFSLQQTSCGNTTPISCTVTVQFTPKYPGLRQDAINAFGPNGALAAVTMLYGIGLGPGAVLRPGILNDIAGNGEFGDAGDGGPALSAWLSNPQGLAVDNKGNVYISDSLDQVVRKVDATTGNITTVAGGGTVNGSNIGDGGPATSAVLNVPSGLAVDGAGNLYIADAQNNRVRRVDAQTQIITTVAGNGTVSASLGDGGAATLASLYSPVDVAVDGAGNLFIADQYNYLVRRVDAATGVITTVAGGGTNAGNDGLGDGGPASSAILGAPAAIALDAAGNLYIADISYDVIRKVSVGAGVITVVGGTVGAGSFNEPNGLRVDAAGNIYVSDTNNSLLWEINGEGLMFVLAGQVNQEGYNGDGVLASQAELSFPFGIALDPAGNIYIADQGNGLVRKLVPGPAALSFPTTNAGSISSPQTVAIDNIGNQPLTFSAFGLTGNFTQQNSGATGCGAAVTVQPATTCLAAIAFAPQASGLLSGVLSWQTNAQTAATVLALSGTGTGSGNTAPTLSTATLLYASQAAGTSSAAQTITLSNPGTSSLSQPQISISGTNRSDFSAQTTCSGQISADGSCSISVTFSPASTGNSTATLAVLETNTTTNTQFTQTVNLTGVGSATSAVVSPSAISFNNSGANALPTTETVTLSNPNAVALGILSISTSRADLFSLASNCGASLAAQTSCAVAVTFTPTTSNVSPAALTFTFTSGTTASVTLTTANPTVSLTGPSGSFGPQTRNLRSLPFTYGLQNLGASALTISSVAIGGTNAGDFQQVNDCGTSVAAGQGCTIWVTYLPTGNSPSSSSAALIVTDSAAGSPHSIAITGAATGLSQAQINIDGPGSGATVSGTVPLTGWAISNNAPITTVGLAVDGVSLGSATYGTSRPDVCSVYPGRANCPNVGWGSTLDSTRLADGPHTLTVTASSQSGETTVKTSFTTNNVARGVNSATKVNIDFPGASGSVLAGSVTIGGWALDDRATVNTVSVFVDGSLLESATYGENRTDVCNVYTGRPNCPQVGWTAALDTTQFPDGTHTLAIQAHTSDGRFASVSNTFSVANGNTGSSAIAFMDYPNATSTVSGTLTASGWAIDPSSSVTAVNLSVDGAPQGTASSTSRPDVCNAFGNVAGCPNVGWSKSIDTTTLADGAHTLAVSVTSANGHHKTISSRFTVSNQKNPNAKTTMVYMDFPNAKAGTLSGQVTISGWAIDQVSAISNVTVSIDGVPYTTVVPSITRSDVCAAFSSAVGCPVVGWKAVLDTTTLADGQHSLQIMATSQQGRRAFTVIGITCSNAAARSSQGQQAHIDGPGNGSQISGTVAMSGWAVNTTASIQQVAITADGVYIGQAEYGAPRGDVCGVYPSQYNCPNVGWTYSLDTTKLSDGQHHLQAIASSSNGSVVASTSVVVTNAHLPIRINIDTPAPNGTYSGTIPVSGWAIDDADSLKQVFISVDGLPLGPVAYGTDRGDVCAVFPGRAGCPNVGWTFSLDSTPFANGRHTLQITAISAGNATSTTAIPVVIGN